MISVMGTASALMKCWHNAGVCSVVQTLTDNPDSDCHPLAGSRQPGDGL